MATTSNTYTGNGSNKLFSITFPYIDATDVDVYLNGTLQTITTQYTFANATTIEFVVAPGAGTKVYLQRTTENETNAATFFAGSSIKAADLNDNFDQALYTRQELIDNTWNNTNETIESFETWVSSDAYIATTQSIDQRVDFKVDTALTGDVFGSDGVSITDNTPGSGQITVGLSASSVDLDRIKDADIITTAEQNAGSPSWVSDDTKISTIGAAAKRFDSIVQTSTPSGTDWQIGKTWLQNDVNNTLYMWDGSIWKGIASGGTFTTQPTVVYVDNVNGNDSFDGHRIINPMKTIKAAVASASAGWIIKVAPGVYQESLPIDITVANLSIVGEAQRSCFVHPTVATQEQIMFRCNSGTYIDGFTFAGLKASGARGGNAIDSNATYGLPTNQGWVAGFYPGCLIKKSPYINNCTNFADSGIDNSAFDPNNYAGTGGDLTSAPTGGGIIVDGSVPSVSSPLRSFVVNEFTQVCLDGPGLLVCNNGYAQAVSFFGLFCHYHAKALSGGQINMEVGTTDFGRYGLIADGKSTAAIFTATANGAASANATTFAINAPTAGGTWFGDATRPAINMLVQIGSDIYPILSSTANGAGWNVVISRPNPSNRAQNLGLINSHANGAAVSFFLRSMVSTASHTMEYAGSGTNYNALPENGGVANETNESVNLNNGRVWLTSTDQSGKFKVGDTFAVDQQTGFVTIDPNSYSTNLVSDLTPELGGDLDVLTRNIYSSVGPLKFVTGGSEKVRLDSNGRLLVGTSTAPTGSLSATSFFHVRGNTASSSGGGQLNLSSNQTSAGLNGWAGSYHLGRLIFTDTQAGEYAHITCTVDTNNAGVGSYPGRLVFSTTADGSATPTERMRIDSTGLMTLAGPGIKFPATQVASADPNTLDDYEEGTWTPSVAGITTAGTATYGTRTGFYTKIGALVTFSLTLSWSGGTGAGNIYIPGLPFVAQTGNTNPAVSLACGNLALSAGNVPAAYVVNGNSYIVIKQMPTGGGALTNVPYDASVDEIYIAGSYTTF
jgi:hypothetical protein